MKTELSILPILIPYNEKERRMMKNHPQSRITKLEEASSKYNMTIYQSCSLRRHYIKYYNPYKTMSQLKLGKMVDIKRSANIFEQCVENYLTKCNIDFISEAQQRLGVNRRENIAQAATPDFLFKTPITIELMNDNNEKNINNVIYWIEAKMFYGASSIPFGTNNAAGSIYDKIRQYVDVYGCGAIVFSEGFGLELSDMLKNDMGVSVLDGDFLDLYPLREVQRTWCANREGKILP